MGTSGQFPRLRRYERIFLRVFGLCMLSLLLISWLDKFAPFDLTWLIYALIGLLNIGLLGFLVCLAARLVSTYR